MKKYFFYLVSFAVTIALNAQNVGIGIITPTAKLHSISSINAPAGRFEATSTSFSAFNSGYGVLTGKYTGAAINTDIVGVYGQSVPGDFYGYGGYFQGGYTGVKAIVIPTGPNSYLGLWGDVNGGTGTNYGVRGSVSGTGINYAIYADAGGGSANWAGYFLGGNVYMQNRVGIGINTPLHKLHVIDPTAGAMTIWGENTNSGTDGYGIYGQAINGNGLGIGMKAVGGWKGIEVHGNGASNPGNTYGVEAVADGAGAGMRIGVIGSASGGATNYGVVCNGSGTYSGSWTNVSDQKFKKDLLPVTGALGLINQLNPVSYELKTDEYPMMNFPATRQYGFVAQELEKVIPLLVENGMHPGATKEDKNIELKAVNYIGMIPILTKAIQEQQQMIEELKTEIENLKAARNR